MILSKIGEIEKYQVNLRTGFLEVFFNGSAFSQILSSVARSMSIKENVVLH